jgi:uncharacterized protein (DUF924 family)
MDDGRLKEVLGFWFEELEPRQWWTVDTALDDAIRARFGALLQQAIACELSGWRSSPRGRLAEVIVLDQFSRNVHRGTPQAFAQDSQALSLAQEAVRGGSLSALSDIERAILLLPYMHSESRMVHAEAAVLYQQFAPAENYEFELRHKAIIDRFGRYPHRNRILGRTSTEAEIEFLGQPGSSF